MDVREVWSKTTDSTKTARAKLATTTTNTLDALSPTFVPLAQVWDKEAARRDLLRTPENLKALLKAQTEHRKARSTAATAKAQNKAETKATRNYFNAARRSARKAEKAAKGHQKTAKVELKEAQKNYPQTLRRLAVKAHSVHVAAAGLSSYGLSTADDWAIWPGATSLGLVTLNVAGVWLGRRTVSVQLDDDMSTEEKRLASRLEPSYWVKNAEDRGLSGTTPTPAELTPYGLVSHVRLDAKWTPKGFRAKADEIRALIGARTDLRMEIKAGSHGDRATIILRTRSAADGMDLCGWKPGDCWAVDTVTGEPVPAPLGKRILIAGTSGSGKSTSARPLLAEASEYPDHRLVIFDRKYVEARTWEHRARVACELEDMRELANELIAEGEERLKSLPRGVDTVEISPERPRITVFVDEMAEAISDCKATYKDEDGKNADYNDVIAAFRTIARKYRAAEIILVPATQKPTLSGDGHGLDSQVAGQLTIRLALAVATSTETQAVFGPDAIEKGWKAHELPMPWVALMRDQDKGPKQRTNPIQMRWMTAQQVIDLPARPIWSRATAVPERPTGLKLVKGEAVEAPAEAAATAPETSRERVLRAIQGGATTNKAVENATGIPKGTVSKTITALVKDGLVERAEDKSLKALGGAA